MGKQEEDDGDDSLFSTSGTTPFSTKKRRPGFDPVYASREHSQLLFTLIKSDVQNRRDDDILLNSVERKPFPLTYTISLSFLRKEVLTTVFNTPSLKPMYTAVRTILKKEGLLTVRLSPYMTVREIVEIKRKIERSLSSIILVLITYRLVPPPPLPPSPLSMGIF